MAIVVDAHSDILNDIHPRRILGEREVLKNDWVPKMKKGGIDIRVVALYSDIQYLPELALRRGLDLVETLYEEIEECPDAMLCTTYNDISRPKRKEKSDLSLVWKEQSLWVPIFSFWEFFTNLVSVSWASPMPFGHTLPTGPFFQTEKKGKRVG